MITPTSTLTAQILEILFKSPTVRRPWKDALSDRLLDAYEAGTPLTPQELLQALHEIHPQVFERLTVHPLVRDDVMALRDSLVEADRR